MGNRWFDSKALLNLAHFYATRFSGCTKVSVGSVITDGKGNILSLGANAAVPDLCKTNGCLRVTKYGENSKLHRAPEDCRALHSEIDAICHLQQSAAGGAIFVTRYPCEACARAIVAAGIKTVYYGRKQNPSSETMQIFDSADVECIHVNWDAEDSYV